MKSPNNILFLAFVLLFISKGNAQDTLHFTMNAHHNLLFSAQINQSDSVQLMLHTAINDFSLIANGEASMNWKEADSVESWGGTSAARYCDSNDVTVGNFNWQNLRFWKCLRSGLGSHGKFGLNAFENAHVELQFEASQLITYSELPKDLQDYQKCPLIAKDGLFFIEMTFEVNDTSYTNEFLIHTGYGGTLLLDDAFVQEHNLADKIQITDQKILTDSFGNEIAVNKGVLTKVHWLNEELKNVPVGFFEGKIARQSMSILGADFLRRFNVIFDQDRAFVYVKSNTSIHDEFSTI